MAARARPCAARTRLFWLIDTPNGALHAPPCPSQLRCFLLDLQIYKICKVLTYEEYRAVSGVFQNIDPPTPFHSASVSSPAPKAGGTHSPGSATILFFCSYLFLFFSSYLFLFFSYNILLLLILILIFKLFVVLQTCVLNTHLAKVHT